MSLFLDSVRTYVFSVHSEKAVTMSTVPFTNDGYQLAAAMWLKKHGEMQEYSNGNLLLYKIEREAGVTIGLSNKFVDKNIVATVDCSDGENILSNRGNLVAESTISPGQTVVAHHLVCGGGDGNWSWGMKLGAKSVPLKR